MLWKSALATDLSGSIGGLTASRNRGGQYFRARVVPVNPATVFQMAVRGFVAQLTNAWLGILTLAQRQAWDAYALEIQIPNALGDPRNVSGIAMYVRSNVPRLQAGLARVDDGPPIDGLGLSTNPAFDNFVAAATTFDVTFGTGIFDDPWANETGSAMLVLASRARNASINFFKGPYRFAGLIAGDDTIAPTSPQTFTSPFPFAVGQRVFIQTRVSRRDGRLNLPFRGFGLGA